VWFELPDRQQLHLIEYQPVIDSRVTFRRKPKGKRINFKDVHFALRVRDYDAMYEILSQCGETIQLGPVNFSAIPWIPIITSLRSRALMGLDQKGTELDYDSWG
jgi:hypothetical protein